MIVAAVVVLVAILSLSIIVNLRLTLNMLNKAAVWYSTSHTGVTGASTKLQTPIGDHYYYVYVLKLEW